MELYSTFDNNFLFSWLRKADQETVLEWNELSVMLKDYMADDAYASYLSLELVVQFWRNLVASFPEVQLCSVFGIVMLEYGGY